jgi:AcrR family transcriptional regulator
MLAKKAVSADTKSNTRNKDAKIETITEATVLLIETKGYDKVTIRDIAECAGVSVGLIYKYFPGGKFDILVKGLGLQTIESLLSLKQPENIDYDDFPGYMRNFIKNWQQLLKDHSHFIKAILLASLIEGEMSKDIKNLDVKDYMAISKFFGRFKGIDMSDKDPAEILLNWGITIKGVLILNLIYPTPMINDDVSTDLLVDLSLHIWGYKKP